MKYLKYFSLYESIYEFNDDLENNETYTNEAFTNVSNEELEYIINENHELL